MDTTYIKTKGIEMVLEDLEQRCFIQKFITYSEWMEQGTFKDFPNLEHINFKAK